MSEQESEETVPIYLHKAFYERIRRVVEGHRALGYLSVTDFVESAVRREIELIEGGR